MIPLKLELKLPFDDILFKGFLPEDKRDGLQISVHDGKYKITVYLSNRNQLSSLSEIPKDPEKLKKHMNIPCKALTMEVEIPNPDPEIIYALESNQQNEKTEEFGRDIFNIIIENYIGIIDYFRNIEGQYWLKPFLQEQSIQNHLDFYFEVRWFSSKGKWLRFKVFEKNELNFRTRMFPEGLDRDTWDKIQTFINKKKFEKTPLRKVLIANSLQHLSYNNERLAIVEAVIAWEETVRNLLPNILKHLTLSIEKRESLLVLLKKKNFSLRNTSYIGLRLLIDSLEIERSDIDLINKAILERNRILHSPSRKTNIENARKYVYTIKKIITVLEKIK